MTNTSFSFTDKMLWTEDNSTSFILLNLTNFEFCKIDFNQFNQLRLCFLKNNPEKHILNKHIDYILCISKDRQIMQFTNNGAMIEVEINLEESMINFLLEHLNNPEVKTMSFDEEGILENLYQVGGANTNHQVHLVNEEDLPKEFKTDSITFDQATISAILNHSKNKHN